MMDSTFPFGFPLSAALYLTLYVATLVLHVVFMNYVLAGSCYLALRNIVRGGRREGDIPAGLLRDWLPFMLSAAITAGIGPLLFVQVLYQEQFYTANLLLFGRWMAILPVLIAGFYLLYLLKSESKWLTKSGVRIGLTLLVFGCFGFVAWSWTENHLLSVRDQTVWSEQYVNDDLIYHTPELYPRLATWFTGCFPTLAILLAWQTLGLHRHRGEHAITADRLLSTLSRLGILALSGMGLAAGCAAWYYSTLSDSARAAITGPVGRFWFALAICGLITQGACWVRQLQANNLSIRRLAAISIGLLATLSGVAAVREALRLSQVDVAELVGRAGAAAEIGGGAVFALFLVINVTLIAYCIRLVIRRAQ